ncbi:hypothetical protein BGZ54_002642 [Gamsiella multidivaricata]|nr:hypothetical protein BGZ54_002642 [Gamsiella multidivaricata]
MRTSVTLDKLACYRIRQTCCDCHPPPWEPSTPPSNANATEWAIAQALEVTSPASVRDNGSDDDDHNNNGDDDNGDNDDSSGDDDDDNGIVGPTTGAVAVAASRRIITIPRVEGASQVVQNAGLDKNGRKENKGTTINRIREQLDAKRKAQGKARAEIAKRGEEHAL